MKTPDHDRPEYGNDTALSDTVFIAALGFLLLFLAALLMIRPPTPDDAQVKMKAEFVLTMTWPDGALDDVDLWLMRPDGQKLSYRRQEAEYVTLDRDDLGALNDFYFVDGERKLTLQNREVATIRAIVPGRYVVSAHVYADRPTITTDGKPWAGSPTLPYEAKLEVTKLNPRVTEVLRATVTLTKKAQEAVFCAFDVDAEGNVTNIELNPQQYQIVDLVPTFPMEIER